MMGYLFYWEDMKKKGEWGGIAKGGMINSFIPQHMRKEIKKEKKMLKY
jgi:hypothetical protein